MRTTQRTFLLVFRQDIFMQPLDVISERLKEWGDDKMLNNRDVREILSIWECALDKGMKDFEKRPYDHYW